MVAKGAAFAVRRLFALGMSDQHPYGLQVAMSRPTATTRPSRHLLPLRSSPLHQSQGLRGEESDNACIRVKWHRPFLGVVLRQVETKDMRRVRSCLPEANIHLNSSR